MPSRSLVQTRFAITVDLLQLFDAAWKVLLVMGGPTVVLGALFAWLGKRYLDRALQRETALNLEHLEKQKSLYAAALETDKAEYAFALEDDKRKYAAALELQKSGQEKRTHVYKAQFEVEFNSYRDLWSALTTLSNAVAVLRNYSPQSLELGDPAKEELRVYAQEADNAFFEANRKNNELSPFIDEEVHHLAVQHNRRCKSEINTFFHAIASPKKRSTPGASYDPEQDYAETKAAFAEISASYNRIGTAIRSRLASMLVIDE